MSTQPTLAEIVGRALESRLGDLYGPMPAIVIAYDPGGPAQAASVDVQPVVQRALPAEDETLVPEPLPVVPNVPVLYPTGAGVRITWALAPGDVVLLVPLMLAVTQWRLTGAPVVAPFTDQALHHLGNCVAIPGLAADALTTAPVDVTALVVEAAEIKLGAGATAFAADADKVDDELQKISTAITGLGGSYTPAPVACTKVKVE